MLVGVMMMVFITISFIGVVCKQGLFPVMIVVTLGIICSGILMKRDEKVWVMLGTILILAMGLGAIGWLVTYNPLTDKGVLDLDYLFAQWVFPLVFAVIFTLGLVLVLLERKKRISS